MLQRASGCWFLFALCVAICSASCETWENPVHPSDVGVYAECGITPSYAASMEDLHRFATFPITVSVDVNPTLVGVATAPSYEEAVRLGVLAWSQVLPDPLGDVVVVGKGEPSNIKIRFVDSVAGSGDDAGTVGVTNYPGTAHVVSHVNIDLGLTNSNRTGPADLLRQLTTRDWINNTASTVAHEMGHAMAIGGHSPSSADLMAPTKTAGGTPVTSRITVADRNTFREAYCRR